MTMTTSDQMAHPVAMTGRQTTGMGCDCDLSIGKYVCFGLHCTGRSRGIGEFTKIRRICQLSTFQMNIFATNCFWIFGRNQ